jgi:predicted dehydrogenase
MLRKNVWILSTMQLEKQTNTSDTDRTNMETVRFGVIGLGLMGREFAGAAARWSHLPEMTVKPEIVAICDIAPSQKSGWFTDNFSSITQVTKDYKELIKNPDVDAVYCAVPHHLHEEFYCAVIGAGKDLMGEKPFGIDKYANSAILAKINDHPGCFVRCSSEFPFFPAVQRIGDMIEHNTFGTLIEVESGLTVDRI